MPGGAGAPLLLTGSGGPLEESAPEELGWPIALLCTGAASFTSGAILDVNGGMFVG